MKEKVTAGQRPNQNVERGDVRQTAMPLVEAVMEYSRRQPAYFCIPGHRYERGINPAFREAVGDAVFRFDLTETPLTDDLHNASGAILEAERLAAELFGADETHFLVNGTTCGNQIMVLSAALAGQKIAVPRNAHKSMLMGLIMSGAEPVYLMPELTPQFGLHGGITPEACEAMFQRHPDCKAVIVVSPTYYGLCSDIRGIAEVCHKNGALLLVDEAHGAHCYFSEHLPEGALPQGADLCSQSIHKVAGALTQSSMLHIQGRRVDRARVDANLHLVQSTSPSYLLMTSLDAARQDLAQNGREMQEKAIALAGKARAEISRIAGISAMDLSVVGQAGVTDLDRTRLTFSAAELGLSGYELKRLLFDESNCDVELADPFNALAIITSGNTEGDISRLVSALRRISDRFGAAGKRPACGGVESEGNNMSAAMPAAEQALLFTLPIPEYAVSPRTAYFSEKKRVPWEQAKGAVAGEMIAPYPPGIPVVYPGERISAELWELLTKYKQEKRHLHGPSDARLDTFLIL